MFAGENTKSATPQPTKQPDSALSRHGVIQNCISVQPSLPENQRYTGWLVFETHEIKSDNTISLYHFDSNKTVDIANHGRSVSVSPDKKSFAFYDWDLQNLEILSASGEKINSLAWEKTWVAISGWLDQQHLILLTEPQKDTYPRPMTVLNPFTKESFILNSDYPDIDKSAGNILNWQLWGITAYNSLLNRVVYLGTMTVNGEGGMGYTLYGLPEKIILAQFLVQRFNQLPLWFPDGSKFIVKGDGEFIQVSADGKISEVSHMNPDFEYGGATGLVYFSDKYYSWSPDGQHLAFWLVKFSGEYDWQNREPTLAILDTYSGTILDTCISAGYNPHFSYFERDPIWSPDGKSIVVAANYSLEQNSNEVVVVDLEKWEAYKVLENRFPAGWMINP